MDLDAMVDEVLALLEPDFVRLRRGRDRQSAVWQQSDTDYLPLLIANVPVPERDEMPSFNKKEQFCDKRKMLAEKSWDLIGQAVRGHALLAGPSRRVGVPNKFCR